MCGGLRTTPIPLLHSQTGLPPLDDLIEEASLRQFMFVTDNPETLLAQEVDQYDQQVGSPYEGIVQMSTRVPDSLMDSYFEEAMDVPRRILDTMDTTKFTILPTKEVATMYHEANKLIPEADWYLFTDGSYLSGSDVDPAEAGSGVVLMDSTMTTFKSEGCKVVPACYSYHSEMAALTLGLDLILKTDEITMTPGSTVCVLTDSQSLLTHLDAVPRRVRPYVYESTMTMMELIQRLDDHQVKLHFVWIPGHTGIPGNEEADKLAKASITSEDVYETNCPINMFRSWIKKHRVVTLKNYLDENVNQSQVNPSAPSRDHFKMPMNSPSMVSGRDRRVDVSLFRLFSGHTNTRDHWSRIGIKQDTMECRYCHQADESAEHLVTDCDALWSQDRTRVELLIRAQIDEYGHPVTFQQVLSHRDDDIYQALVKVVEHLADLGVVL